MLCFVLQFKRKLVKKKLLFSIRVAELSAVRERAVHLVYHGVLRKRLSLCVCASLPFCFESGTWDLIVLVSNHCFFLFNDEQLDC